MSSLIAGLGVLGVIVFGYGWAYYRSVIPSLAVSGGRGPTLMLRSPPAIPRKTMPSYFPGWQILEDYQDEFFAPAHWLDRRIRPDVWEP